MIFGIILASGNGSRMGDVNLPKQFALLHGKPVVVYSLAQFLASDKLDAVITVVSSDLVDYAAELFQKHFGDEPRLHITTGGPTISDSLVNACAYIRKNLSDDLADIVVTHDAARPFVTQKMIDSNLAAIENCDAVCTAIPVTDTILHAADGSHVTNIPNRSEYFQVQTPQTFRANVFCELYEALDVTTKSELTDACRVFTSAGKNVTLVAGDKENIKITFPQDFIVAETIASKL